MKLDAYRCDRCGKEFHVDAGEKPPTVTVEDFSEQVTRHLCHDCAATLHSMMHNISEFDKLADKLERHLGER